MTKNTSATCWYVVVVVGWLLVVGCCGWLLLVVGCCGGGWVLGIGVVVVVVEIGLVVLIVDMSC